MAETAVENSPNGNAASQNSQNGQVSPQGNGEQNQEGENQEQGRRSFFDITKGFLMRALLMYFIASFFRKSPTTTDNSTAPARPLAFNYFENGTLMDLYIFMSEDEVFRDFDNKSALIGHKENIIYGDWSESFSFYIKFDLPESLKKNGSLYLHSYFVKKDSPSARKQGKERFNGLGVAYSTRQLNKFKKVRFTKTQNLLTGETPLTAEEVEEAEKRNRVIVSHWHPNITLSIVVDHTNWVQGSVPSALSDFMYFSPTGDYYKPIVFYNDFWNLMRDYRPINETTKQLELQVSFEPLSLFKWQLYSAHSMRNKFSMNFLQDDMEEEDQDSLKEALLETSLVLLVLTVVISILHSVFELLAFKNDIQFWNNRKSLEGLSVRSVFFNVFQSLIVLLYVLDNDTSTLIKISCFIGLAIEIWKINKVVDIGLDREHRYFNLIPRLKLTDKGSYVESSTKQYDQLAFKYLSWLLFPMLIGYAIYSLIYLHHKGWYSWVLNMIYGFLLTFGFIMMTPQLFINYKLKSVAHLPWRMMSYKCLNTFIDDIFAFVIKMPTMYRLGCFRDDIVFFIFLYQRWIYKTDPKRINEFGFSGEMENPESVPVEDTPAEEPVKSIEDKKED